MNDYRRTKRRKVAQAIEVTDAMTDVTIGRIGNVSESGMLMVATVPPHEDALYQLRFAVADQAGRERLLEVGAHALWLDTANVPGQFWAGFRFIDMAPDDADALRRWIESPGAQYV
jgi:hypothetical protein